jgi:hypothetical protein
MNKTYQNEMLRSSNSKNRQYNEQKIPKEMIRSSNSQNRQYNEQKIPKEMIRSRKKKVGKTIQ